MKTFLNEGRYIEIFYDCDIEKRVVRAVWNATTRTFILEANSDGMAYLATNFLNFLCSPQPTDFYLDNQEAINSPPIEVVFALDKSLDSE